MAILKSLFNNGAGKTASETALQYNTATKTLSTAASSLLALGSAGFSLASNTFTGTALATSVSAYIGLNDNLASQGYVDEQINALTPSIPGDATFIDFPVASGYVALTAGTVVAVGASGPVPADSASDSASNAIGVFLSKPNATTARVQVDGEVALATDLAAYANGALVWVDSSGSGTVTSYTAIPSGEYATQVGIVTNYSADKIVLQQRIFGQTA